jgi:hypothetical protein
MQVDARALLLTALCSACTSISLARSADTWKETGAIYSIAALPDGRLMPNSWKVDNFDVAAQGFQKQSFEDARDLLLKRVTDDGALVVVTESTKPEDAQKVVDVFADRWIASMLENPHEGVRGIETQDGRSGLYDDVLPPVPTTKATVNIPGHLFPTEVDTQVGRRVEIARREPFVVPGGDGVEAEVHASPEGPGLSKDLYLAVLRPKGQDRIIVVAYSNTKSLFAEGESDAAGLARRIRFP